MVVSQFSFCTEELSEHVASGSFTPRFAEKERGEGAYHSANPHACEIKPELYLQHAPLSCYVSLRVLFICMFAVWVAMRAFCMHDRVHSHVAMFAQEQV